MHLVGLYTYFKMMHGAYNVKLSMTVRKDTAGMSPGLARTKGTVKSVDRDIKYLMRCLYEMLVYCDLLQGRHSFNLLH